MTIVGGSAVVAAIGDRVSDPIATVGLALFVFAGALLIAIRPADKVAQNDSDVRRYKALMSKSVTLTESELEKALEEARLSDTQEIEPLRDVAYNDVAIECARPEFVVKLRPLQKLLAALA